MSQQAVRDRVRTFTDRFGLRLPILLAPRAGACPPSLSIAVANAGRLGSCGALLMGPDGIVNLYRCGRADARGAGWAR